MNFLGMWVLLEIVLVSKLVVLPHSWDCDARHMPVNSQQLTLDLASVVDVAIPVYGLDMGRVGHCDLFPHLLFQLSAVCWNLAMQFRDRMVGGGSVFVHRGTSAHLLQHRSFARLNRQC